MRQAIHFSFSPICLSDHFCWSLAERKWRNGAKQMIKSKGDSCVVSLSSRFILVLLLWLQCGRKKKGRQSVNPFIDHLVILSSYLVVKVKCVIGLVASQQARLKGSIKTVTSRVKSPHVPCAYKGWNMLFTAIKAYTGEDNKKGREGKKAFSNLFIK